MVVKLARELLLIASRVKFFLKILLLLIWRLFHWNFLKTWIFSLTMIKVRIERTSMWAPKCEGNDQFRSKEVDLTKNECQIFQKGTKLYYCKEFFSFVNGLHSRILYRNVGLSDTWYFIKTNVIVERLSVCRIELCKVKNVTKSGYPESDKTTPEVVIDSRGVFDPKDEKILDENERVKEEKKLGLQRIL